MGSEQSNTGNSGNKIVSKTRGNLQSRRRKIGSKNNSTENNIDEDRCVSPELSVCSDSDLPYISYTVNRPIGDSPKMSGKNSALQRGKSFGGSAGNSPMRRRNPFPRKINPQGHNIVVVKQGNEPDSQDKDPNLQRLHEIPMFLPIMRGTLNLPGMRDPEVLEKLDPNDLLGVCKKMQNYMSVCSDHVSTSQMQITNRIREVDFDLCKLVTTAGERQKKLSKQSEKLSKVTELEHHLNKCHTQLNTILELMEEINNKLPISARLEPFVWTTG